MPIDTVDSLREHLQLAIEVELSTIPPYLYAMYSVDDPASPATKLIRSVAAEEMLHATLMANILLATGGEPRFYDPKVLPAYPSPLPHHVPELILELERLSPELVERVFLTIERPAPPGAPAEPDEWESQGQFYRALEDALRRLDGRLDLFANPQRDRQLHDPHGYVVVKYDSAASGGLSVVDDLESAIAAMEVAVHQGEGVSEERFADARHSELTHHARFRRLLDGTIEAGTARPLTRSPSVTTLPAEVQPVATFANAIYSYLFVVMDRLLAPDTEDRHALVGALYGTMIALLAPVARYLTTMPAGTDEVAGPPFEHYEFADPRDAESELRAIGGALVDRHPRLRPAVRQLSRLGGRAR